MRSPTHGEDTTREGEFRSPRAGPVVLAGGAAALGPHMAGPPSHVCMEGARSHSGQRSAAATALQVLESLHVPSPMMAMCMLNC